MASTVLKGSVHSMKGSNSDNPNNLRFSCTCAASVVERLVSQLSPREG